MNTPILSASAPQREKLPVTKHQAFRDLALTVCACGHAKVRMMSHCRTCYDKLPRQLRNSLYSTYDGYVAPYNASLDFLGLESPTAKVDRLAADAIREGQQIVIREVELRLNRDYTPFASDHYPRPKTPPKPSPERA